MVFVCIGLLKAEGMTEQRISRETALAWLFVFSLIFWAGVGLALVWWF
jgi:hypothetical protein